MIFIAIGVIMIVIGCILFHNDWIGTAICIFVASLCVILAGFFSTPVGYDYNLLYEVRLAEGQTASTVTIDKARESTNYYEKIESELCEYDEKAYAPTISMDDVIFIESESIEVPVLQFYELTGKKSIWSFAYGFTGNKYVFKVPQGTVTLISTVDSIELE